MTYGHTPMGKMFNGDVYGIGYDEQRAAKRRIRLGIIGVGGVAQSKYIPAVNRLKTLWEQVELSAFCTRNTAQTEKMKDIVGGRWYTDYKDMLSAEPLDGMLVCSADGVHAEHALACMERGLGVMVEKPITRSLCAARELVDSAEKLGVPLMTVANKRYSPPYRYAKAAISDDTVADPAMFYGKFNLGYDYVDILEGGTVHLFDITRYLMGDITALCASTVLKFGRNTTGYPFDNGVCTLNFASGAVGSVMTSSSALSLKPWERVEVYGEKSWLSVDDQCTLTIHASEQEPSRLHCPVWPNTLITDVEFGGFAPMIQDFIDSLRDGTTPLVNGADGYKALELVAAFHLSAHRGETVPLPLDPDRTDAELRKILGAIWK